jgi:hypothetical protein
VAVRSSALVIAAAAGVALGTGAAACRRPREPVKGELGYPPSVLKGEADLVCDISARKNGHQKLTLRDGTGLEFDAVVSPIVDGTVTANGPAQGGLYRFTSHLAAPAKGKLASLGEVDIEELETKVAVEMSSYAQPGGLGTTLTFTARQMASQGIYVEFAGRARAATGDRYAFRVNLGAATDGSGHVQPADDNRVSHIEEKGVRIRAPTSTVYVTATTGVRLETTRPR